MTSRFQMQLPEEWSMESDEEDYDDDEYDEREKKKIDGRGQQGMEGRMKGDVRDEQGRELPESERARLDRVGR